MRTALVAIALAVVPAAAAAAELPASLHGAWRVANPSGDQCRRDDVKGALEGHIIVGPTGVAQYESTCRVAAVRPTRRSERERASIVADLRCAGEGMRWRARTLFHLETVAGNRLIAVTTFGPSATRDARGRRIEGPDGPTTTIYTECR